MSHCLLLLALLFVGRSALAQNGYALVGNARPAALPDCYQLTESRPQQGGALWAEQRLRVDASFSLEFTVNFGADGTGGEGAVMVLQTVGNRALGETGPGLGYRGLRPSLGIEFDTFRNPELGDPDMDHVALVRGGLPDHRVAVEFAQPVQLSSVSKNAKDGRDHRVRVSYDAPARRLEVFVDCVRRISQAIDLAGEVFRGTPGVVWGFTAATGAATNSQTVCLPKNPVALDTLRACRGDAVTLTTTGPSSGDRYDWRPAADLSDPAARNPTLTATTSRLYTVGYLDRCLSLRIDSVFVRVDAPPALSLGGDRTACEGEPVELVASLTPASPQARFRWSTGDSTQRLRPTQSGRYAVRVETGSCRSADSATVTFYPLPQLAPGPGDDCLRDQPLLLDPRATAPTPLRYAWTPTTSTTPTLTVAAPGTYAVRVQTEFGCAVERRFEVRGDCAARVFVPDAFSPNGDGLNDALAWFSTEAVEAKLTVYDRWGEVIFFSEKGPVAPFWDGTHGGLPCPPGSYAWRLDYRPLRLGSATWFVKHGRVVLVR